MHSESWPPKDAADLESALNTLRPYHRGSEVALLDPVSRAEQLLTPLPEEDQQIAEMLLAVPGEGNLREAALRSVGLERSLDVLTRVLMPRVPVIGLSKQLVHPWQTHAMGAARVTICSLWVGDSGVRVEAKLRLRWTHLPLTWRPWRIEWAGIAEIKDDLRTVYRRVASPFPQSRPTRRGGLRMVQNTDEYWVPGPPREAQHLLLVPTPRLTIHESSRSSSEVSARQRPLKAIVCSVKLGAEDIEQGQLPLRDYPNEGLIIPVRRWGRRI